MALRSSRATEQFGVLSVSFAMQLSAAMNSRGLCLRPAVSERTIPVARIPG